MILYISVTVITVALALFVNNQRALLTRDNDVRGMISREKFLGGLCLVTIFVILFALSACRLNVGNDYAKYVEFMHRLYCDAYIDDPGVPTEWGFNLLTRVIYGLSGYENYLLVFAIYSFFTVWFFLKAIYEQSVSFPLSFLMFMGLGYYFQSFSTVRYYLALGIALYSIRFVRRKEWIRFFLCVFAGAAFHKSIWVILPIYILATLPWKKWQMAILILLGTTGLFLQEWYLKVILALYPTYAETEYLEGTGLSYINILRCLGVLVLALLVGRYAGEKTWDTEFYFRLNLAALALYLFFGFIPFVSRIAYYLSVTQILYVPALIGMVEEKRWKKLLTVATVAACVLYFAMYLMKASSDGVLVLPYKSVFFHEMVDILSDVA